MAGRFIFDRSKKFFAMKVVRHRSLREDVDDPSLKLVKAMLDGALSNLV